MKTMIDQTCEMCGKSFSICPSQVHDGWGRFCSRPCANKAMYSSIERNCEWCGKPMIVRQCQILRGYGRYCDKKCKGKASYITGELFWAQVDKTAGPDECWPWLGSLSTAGYGRVGDHNRIAHRVAYELINGPIPKGLLILHQCDNPRCVNPRHLRVGTQKDNMQDAARKGRTTQGESHGLARLTKDQVIAIRDMRAAGGITYREIGEKFGIAQGTASDICLRRRWKHIK